MTHYILAGENAVKAFFDKDFSLLEAVLNDCTEGTIIIYDEVPNNVHLLLNLLSGWRDFIQLTLSDLEEIKSKTNLEFEDSKEPFDEIDHAKKTLKKAGYFVDNLWSIEDVQLNYKCTEEEAQELLNKALTNDATMEQIQFSIREFSEEKNLPKYIDGLFVISGFFKEDKLKFSDYLVYEYDNAPEDEDINEDAIFFYGLSEENIKEAIKYPQNSTLDFTITSYERAIN